MMNFVLGTLCVMTGTLLASGVAVALLLNKKVLKKYIKYTVKLGQEINEEIIDEL